MKRWSRVIFIAVAAAALGACVSGRPHLENVSQLQAGEVVVVGRIELVPPLAGSEQELNTATSGRFRGKAHALIAERQFDLDDLPMSAGKHSVFFEFGKYFYARLPRASQLYYSGSVVLMRSTVAGVGNAGRTVAIDHSQLKLPGRLKYTLVAGDRAVYIGTLRYHRDDYNAITKVELLNDFDQASREFAQRFGQDLKLRRLAPQAVK